MRVGLARDTNDVHILRKMKHQAGKNKEKKAYY